MLTQAAGRAGRGEKPGKVVIQTYDPANYAIQAAASQDYEGFYWQEILFRSLAGYPPVCAMMAIHGTSKDEGQLDMAMGYLKKLLDFLKAKQSEINEFQSSSFKDKQLEVITEKIKLIESVKNIEAIEVTDANILEKINDTPLFRIDKENEVKNDTVCSYHTFIFPFRIIDKSNGIKRKEHDFSAYNTKEILEKEISIANDSVWKKSENYSSKESLSLIHIYG